MKKIDLLINGITIVVCIVAFTVTLVRNQFGYAIFFLCFGGVIARYVGKKTDELKNIY